MLSVAHMVFGEPFRVLIMGRRVLTRVTTITSLVWTALGIHSRYSLILSLLHNSDGLSAAVKESV